jgi:hypothetical protein
MLCDIDFNLQRAEASCYTWNYNAATALHAESTCTFVPTQMGFRLLYRKLVRICRLVLSKNIQYVKEYFRQECSYLLGGGGEENR